MFTFEFGDEPLELVSPLKDDSKGFAEEEIWGNPDYESESKQLANARFKHDTQLRGSLALIFTVIIVFWLMFVVITLWCNATLKLSDAILITLLTTTTINVLGMMLIILHDLFPGKK